MPITNFFEFEILLEDAVKDLFSPGMVFRSGSVVDLDNEDFTKFTVDEDKVGLLIICKGRRFDELISKRNSKQQKIKFFYQLVVVTPIDLYDTIGGVKEWELWQRIIGLRVSDNYTRIQLIRDERDFNEPEFSKDLAYLPILIEVDAVLSGE